MKIKKGRIFNHRDGMAELDRFIASQMPTWLGKIRKDFAVTDQITLPEFRQIIEALSIAIQALEAVQFGSLEATFKQCTQTDQEIAADALKRIAELGGDGE